MLFMVFTVLTIVFYCSHRSMRKRTTTTRERRWMESDASLEVYTVDQVKFACSIHVQNHQISFDFQFFDRPQQTAVSEPTTLTDTLLLPVPEHGQPPPPYDAVIAEHYSGYTVAPQMLRFPQHPHRIPNYYCQQATGHQNYDLVKKCRQCRRQIKDELEDNCDDTDGTFCQCLLQNADDENASGLLSPAQLRAAQRILNMQPPTTSHKQYERLDNTRNVHKQFDNNNNMSSGLVCSEVSTLANNFRANFDTDSLDNIRILQSDNGNIDEPVVQVEQELNASNTVHTHGGPLNGEDGASVGLIKN